MGAFPGAEFDRHASALAMEALLYLPHTDTNSVLLPVSNHFVTKYQEQIRGLGVDALADVCQLLGGTLDQDTVTRKAIVRHAEATVERLARELPADAVRRASVLLLRLEGAAPVRLESRDVVLSLLSTEQQRSSGGWSTVAGDGGSLFATTEAVRALALFDDPRAHKARTQALRFLTAGATRLVERGRDIDTFELAIVLRALAGYAVGPYQLMSVIETELVRRQDDLDGGWPSLHGRDSSIELTALSVLALHAAGAHAHMPTDSRTRCS